MTLRVVVFQSRVNIGSDFRHAPFGSVQNTSHNKQPQPTKQPAKDRMPSAPKQKQRKTTKQMKQRQKKKKQNKGTRAQKKRPLPRVSMTL